MSSDPFYHGAATRSEQDHFGYSCSSHSYTLPWYTNFWSFVLYLNTRFGNDGINRDRILRTFKISRKDQLQPQKLKLITITIGSDHWAECPDWEILLREKVRIYDVFIPIFSLDILLTLVLHTRSSSGSFEYILRNTRVSVIFNLALSVNDNATFWFIEF